MSCTTPGTNVIGAHVVDELCGRARTILTWTHRHADHRQPRPWLGSVGIALAVSAVLLTGAGLALPVLALCAWWWCFRMPFAWLLPLGLGVLGAAWITVGAGLLVVLPISTAGLIWASIAATFALLAALARALAHRTFD
jgi:hypothetical protein